MEQEVNQLLRRRAALVLEQIDQRIEALIASQDDLAATSDRLRTVPGIGAQRAVLLTCLFRRIGFAHEDALVAFTGLDPRPMDSGQKHGKRRLSKRGPALLRRQLFMMAFSASRTKLFKPVYEALRARGLSSTAPFVILGRKLLKIAFAIWRTQKPFAPERWIAKNA